MSLLQSITGIESIGLTLTLIVVGLAIALVLMFWVFRKIAGDRDVKLRQGRRPRLSVTDAAIIDEKRRLVLVRRDNVEHLVMIGGPTDIVIEQHIQRVAHERGEDAHHGTHGPDHDEPAAKTHHEPAAPAVQEARHRKSEEKAHAAPLQPHSLDDNANGIAPRRVDPAIRNDVAKSAKETPVVKTSNQPQTRASEEARFSSNGTKDSANRFAELSLDQELANGLEAAFSEEEEKADASLRNEVRVTAPAVAADRPLAARPVPQTVQSPRGRSENMEDEMQRLLSELSGSKPN